MNRLNEEFRFINYNPDGFNFKNLMDSVDNTTNKSNKAINDALVNSFTKGLLNLLDFTVIREQKINIRKIDTNNYSSNIEIENNDFNIKKKKDPTKSIFLKFGFESYQPSTDSEVNIIEIGFTFKYDPRIPNRSEIEICGFKNRFDLPIHRGRCSSMGIIKTRNWELGINNKIRTFFDTIILSIAPSNISVPVMGYPISLQAYSIVIEEVMLYVTNYANYLYYTNKFTENPNEQDLLKRISSRIEQIKIT